MLLKMSKEKVSVESDLCGRYNVPEVQSSEVQWPRVQLYRGTNFFIIEFNYYVQNCFPVIDCRMIRYRLLFLLKRSNMEFTRCSLYVCMVNINQSIIKIALLLALIKNRAYGFESLL